MTFREKFVRDNLELCKRNLEKLTDWEKGFIENLETLPAARLTKNQYNRLHEIAEICRWGRFKLEPRKELDA